MRAVREKMRKKSRLLRTLYVVFALLVVSAIATAGGIMYTTALAEGENALEVSIVQDPAVVLTYNGAAQTPALLYTYKYNGEEIADPSAVVTDFTVTFNDGETDENNDLVYSSEIPTFTGAGEHTFSYKATWKVQKENPDYDEDDEENTEPQYIYVDDVTGSDVTIKIEQAPITVVWGTTSFVYNGEYQAPTATLSGATASDAEQIAVNVSGAMKDVGQQYTATATITGAAEVTANYLIPESATTAFNITPYTVVVTAGSASKQYDKTPLSCTDYTIVENGATYKNTVASSKIIKSVTCTGAQTEVKEDGKNTLRVVYEIDGKSYTIYDGVNYNLQHPNYSVTAYNGKLTVTEAEDETSKLGTIYLYSKSTQVTYNGSEQPLEGFQSPFPTYTVDGNTYTVSGVTAKVTGTNAGNYDNTISGTPTVTDASGKDVTARFEIVQSLGKLTITPKSIANAEITLGYSLKYTGSQQTQTVSKVVVDGMTVPSSSYTVSGNTGTNEGGYILSVTASGNFSGTASKSWSIDKANVVTSSSSSSSSSRSSSGGSSYSGRSSSGGSSGDGDSENGEEESDDIILTADEVLRLVSIKIESEDGTDSSGESIAAPRLRVASNLQAAQAILSEESKQTVRSGHPVSVRITMKTMSADLSDSERTAMEKGVSEYEKRLPGLTDGIYLDISIETQNDGGDWQTVSVTDEPVQFIIDVPTDLQQLSDTFYVMRIHDNESTLLYDRDKDPTTVTIETQLFSTYVMMYQDEELAATAEDGLSEADGLTSSRTSSAVDKKYWVILYIYLTAILGVGIAILVLQIREMSWREMSYAPVRTARPAPAPVRAAQTKPAPREKQTAV